MTRQIVAGLVGIALVTTLILPKRQTVQVSDSLFKGSQGLLSTVMGTNANQRLAA